VVLLNLKYFIGFPQKKNKKAGLPVSLYVKADIDLRINELVLQGFIRAVADPPLGAVNIKTGYGIDTVIIKGDPGREGDVFGHRFQRKIAFNDMGGVF
jgi:hypothetical protein